MPTLSDVLGRAALNEARDLGLTVSVKTDVTPEVTVFDANAPIATGPGFLQAGIVVRDRTGKVIASYGDYPPINWFKVAALGLALAALGLVLVRGVVK